MNELKPVSVLEDFFWQYAPSISEIYFWLLFIAGIVICFWTFRKTKIAGFLLVAVFFASPFVNIALRKISHQIHKEALIEAQQAELQREQFENHEPVVTHRHVNLSFFETFLVAGLFMISKKTIKQSEPVK